MWFKSCEALIGQKKSGRRPDNQEALLLMAERLARWSRRGKWQVMWSAEEQVKRLGQWDRSEQLCVTVQEEFFIRPWKLRHLRMNPWCLQAFIAVSLNSSSLISEWLRHAVSRSIPKQHKAFLSAGGAANQLLLIGAAFVSRWRYAP